MAGTSQAASGGFFDSLANGASPGEQSSWLPAQPDATQDTDSQSATWRAPPPLPSLKPSSPAAGSWARAPVPPPPAVSWQPPPSGPPAPPASTSFASYPPKPGTTSSHALLQPPPPLSRPPAQPFMSPAPQNSLSSRYVIPSANLDAPSAFSAAAPHNPYLPPPPPPPPAPAAPAEISPVSPAASSTGRSQNSSGALFGARITSIVKSEQTQKSLQRLAPAAKWFMAGAGKAVSFVAGANSSSNQSPDVQQSRDSPPGPAGSPDNLEPPPPTWGSSVAGSSPMSPPSLTPPDPAGINGLPALSSRGWGAGSVKSDAGSRSPAAGADGGPVSASPLHNVSGGAYSHRRGWSYVSAGDAAAGSVGSNAPAWAGSVGAGAVEGGSDAGWGTRQAAHSPGGADAGGGSMDEVASQMPDADVPGQDNGGEGVPQAKRFAPAAKWLLAGAGKAMTFVVGADGTAKDDISEGGSAEGGSAEGGFGGGGPADTGAGAAAPAGAFDSEPSLPAVDTGAQEAHFAGVAALMAASHIRAEEAETAAPQEAPDGGSGWTGFGGFFRGRTQQQPAPAEERAGSPAGAGEGWAAFAAAQSGGQGAGTGSPGKAGRPGEGQQQGAADTAGIDQEQHQGYLLWGAQAEADAGQPVFPAAEPAAGVGAGADAASEAAPWGSSALPPAGVHPAAARTEADTQAAAQPFAEADYTGWGARASAQVYDHAPAQQDGLPWQSAGDAVGYDWGGGNAAAAADAGYDWGAGQQSGAAAGAEEAPTGTQLPWGAQDAEHSGFNWQGYANSHQRPGEDQVADSHQLPQGDQFGGGVHTQGAADPAASSLQAPADMWPSSAQEGVPGVPASVPSTAAGADGGIDAAHGDAGVFSAGAEGALPMEQASRDTNSYTEAGAAASGGHENGYAYAGAEAGAWGVGYVVEKSTAAGEDFPGEYSAPPVQEQAAEGGDVQAGDGAMQAPADGYFSSLADAPAEDAFFSGLTQPPQDGFFSGMPAAEDDAGASETAPAAQAGAGWPAAQEQPEPTSPATDAVPALGATDTGMPEYSSPNDWRQLLNGGLDQHHEASASAEPPSATAFPATGSASPYEAPQPVQEVWGENKAVEGLGYAWDMQPEAGHSAAAATDGDAGAAADVSNVYGAAADTQPQQQLPWAAPPPADAAAPSHASFFTDDAAHNLHGLAAAEGPAEGAAPEPHWLQASHNAAPYEPHAAFPADDSAGAASGDAPGPADAYMPSSTGTPAFDMAPATDNSAAPGPDGHRYQWATEIHTEPTDAFPAGAQEEYVPGEALYDGGSLSAGAPVLPQAAWEGGDGAAAQAGASAVASAEPMPAADASDGGAAALSPASPEPAAAADRPRPWWERAWRGGSPASDSAAAAASPTAPGALPDTRAAADAAVFPQPDMLPADTAAAASPTSGPADAEDDGAMSPEVPVTQPAVEDSQGQMHEADAYIVDAAASHHTALPDAGLEGYAVPPLGDVVAAGAAFDPASLDMPLPPLPDMAMGDGGSAEASNGFAWEAADSQAQGGAPFAVAMPENGGRVARLGMHENGMHDDAAILRALQQAPATVPGERGEVDDSAMVHPARLRVPQPPSAPSSAPGSARVTGTGEKARAMQQYVLTLEAERNELQRGLDKQMALVRKLADEQMHADDAIEGAKRDVVRLQEELQQALADLATQTAIAAEAAQEAEGARRAVADVLEGRQAIAEENIALEEQLLELRNAAAAEQQARSELDSRLAAAAGEVRAAEGRAAEAAERAERDKARLRQDIAELQEGRQGLMSRLKEMAARKRPARGAEGAVDAAAQTEGARGSGAEQRDAGCQASVVEDALDMARRALGAGGEGQGLTEEEEGVLRDPVSTRIAEQALANVAEQPEPAAEDSRDVLQSWRVLMPPAGWGGGVAATVADTQHSVLESVHGLLDGVAEERARARADLAEKDAQIEALKAALAVAGAAVPPFEAEKTAPGTQVYGDKGGTGEPRVNGAVKEHVEALTAAPVNGVNGEFGVAGGFADVVQGGAAGGGVVPEIQSLGVAAVAADDGYDAWPGVNRGVYYGDQYGAAPDVNGMGGGSSVPSPGWEHVDGAEVARSPVAAAAAPVPVGGADGNVAAGVNAAKATPQKRGWFGGMFGRRTPSPAQARRSILTSD